MVVYQIRNRINGKSYVGQTTKTFNGRYDHVGSWWKKGSGRNRHLVHAAEKYGIENFEVTILEKNVESEERLNDLESAHIDRLDCIHPRGYNMQAGGQKRRNRGHHQETRDLIATHHSGGKVHRLLNNRTGVIHEFVNIQRFADENGLSGPMLTIILQKKESGRIEGNAYYAQHREWSLPETPIRKIRFTSKDGSEEIVLDGVDGGVKGFCKRRGFRSSSNVFALINGKGKSVYGWTAKILS